VVPGEELGESTVLVSTKATDMIELRDIQREIFGEIDIDHKDFQ